jgi:hypothetical protein
MPNATGGSREQGRARTPPVFETRFSARTGGCGLLRKAAAAAAALQARAGRASREVVHMSLEAPTSSATTRRASRSCMALPRDTNPVHLIDHLVIELRFRQLRPATPQSSPAQRACELAHFHRHPQPLGRLHSPIDLVLKFGRRGGCVAGNHGRRTIACSQIRRVIPGCGLGVVSATGLISKQSSKTSRVRIRSRAADCISPPLLVPCANGLAVDSQHLQCSFAANSRGMVALYAWCCTIFYFRDRPDRSLSGYWATILVRAPGWCGREFGHRHGFRSHRLSGRTPTRARTGSRELGFWRPPVPVEYCCR